MKKWLISLLTAWLLLPGLFGLSASPDTQLTKFSQASPYAQPIAVFEEYVARQMELDKAPGLSVGFLKDDFVWARGFGYADFENRAPAKAESSYRLASITKTLTAVAVLQLVEAGKIDLDAEVQTYVPFFPRKKWPVTIRLLLGHLAGISHYRNYETEGHIKVHENTKEALEIFQDFDLVAEPGTKYNYSSYGFNLLGAVIEGASGQSYGDYIRENIFQPLGMADSRMDDPVDLIPNRVKGYRLINGEVKNSEFVDVSSRFAGGGTRSTVVDLLKYARGIIEGRILKEQTYHQMFASMSMRKGFLTGYGMGWSVRPWRGHFQISHGGSQPETKTYLLIFPKEHFAVASASNLEDINLIPYIERLAELVLGEDLNSAAYLPDREGQLLYHACELAFSHGMSQYDWEGKSFVPEGETLAKTFSYFNNAVSTRSLRKNFKKARLLIESGIHPVANQAFSRVGAYMASALEEAYGTGSLQSIRRKGPLQFLLDYEKISRSWASEKKHYLLSKSLSRQLSRWEEDWQRTYTADLHSMFISDDTDFESLALQLKKAFAEAEIYPDFSLDFARAARASMHKEDLDKAFQVSTLSSELYPHSPTAWSTAAEVHLWAGNIKKARDLFKKALALDPTDPAVSLGELRQVAERLENSKKIDAVFEVYAIAEDLYPKSADLQEEMGDICQKTGKKELAMSHYKKALRLNPQQDSARAKLSKLEKSGANKIP